MMTSAVVSDSAAKMPPLWNQRTPPPKIVFQSDYNSTVQGLAAAGMGAALIPRLAYDSSDPYTEVIDVGHLLPPRVIALAWHDAAHLSPIAQAFVELARDACVTIARDEEQRAEVGRASQPDVEAVGLSRSPARIAPSAFQGRSSEAISTSRSLI